MIQKVAIVTGSSSGFGLLCAIELAKANFHVIATMRDVSKSDELIKLAKHAGVFHLIEVHPLDVTSSQSIETFKILLSSMQSIDVLINNAGIAIGGFVEELSINDYREQFEPNFFGVIAVTQAVLPYMRKQRMGKIINMSSISGQFGFPGLSPYVASKHALEGLSESLRLELKPFGIDVILIEPGSYDTNIWSHVETISSNLTMESPYVPYMEKILTELEKGKNNYGDPYEVAKLVVAVSLNNKAKLRYPIGKGVKRNIFLKKIIPWNWIEKMVMKTLFRQ